MSIFNEKDLAEIGSEEASWAEAAGLERSPDLVTDADIEVKAVYTPLDCPKFDYMRDLGFPGQYPYTRGPYPEMWRHRPWRYSLFTGFGSAEDTHERWKFLYESGQRNFSVLPDLPTHMGLDSDNPLAIEEVGLVGLAIDSLKDFEILFEGLPIDETLFSCNEETLAAIIIAFFIAMAEKRGIERSGLRGAISNDPLAAVHKGTTVFPLKHGVRLACDLIEYCSRELPLYYPINLKAVNLSEGGANCVQEVAFTLSNAICYIEELLARGLEIDAFAPKLSIFFASGIHIIEEAAKYRAARRMWARMMKERFGAQKPESLSLKFTAMANPNMLQAEEPELNLVRAAYGALASALGGASGTPHPCYDEAYAIPTQKSQSLALGTLQILAEETNVTKTVDPLGGSYYVENLTNRIEEEVLRKMKKIEDLGGAVQAIESGYIPSDIMETFVKERKAIESGEKVIVRKNKYIVPGEDVHQVWDRLEVHKTDPKSTRKQIERLHSVRNERDNEVVHRCLDRLRSAAKGKDNLMPYLIDAAKAYATIGEITAVLKEIFGQYIDSSAF
ncbi:MAG: methylmalonyl-CoA mutase family protein [Pseudomonadota bacterium]